jgi:iron complex outermembrane receptor protein
MQRTQKLLSWMVAVALVATPAVADEVDEKAPRFKGETEVVASRVADDPAATGRREVILSREEIAALPVQTLQDILAVLPGLALSRRGARGVQGDLNLRGSTFEQVAVLVNGVRVNNPQTGHLHLDLFIPAAAIERVEVLLGPGSAVHGPDAFGGAINIVTGPPPAEAFVRVGSNHLTGGGIAGATGHGLWGAVEREVHTGFRDDTEAWVNQAAGGWSWRRQDASYSLTIAAGKRRFGAWSFYSTSYPNQKEETAGQLVTFKMVQPLGDRLALAVALRLDRHRDLFVLDRERPQWYRNRHRTRGLLADVVLTGTSSGYSWALGIEAARDEIDSSNLGRHHQRRTAAFFEIGRDLKAVSAGLQLRIDRDQSWGSVSTVAAGGSWRIGEDLNLRLHHGESFRTPSFTELYYTSPATMGNPELEPERGHTTELGIESSRWSLTMFRRQADPVIDFVLDDDQVWYAENIGRTSTRGLEAELQLPRAGRLAWQRLGIVYLDSDIDIDPQRSRYSLAHPRLEASWTGALQLSRHWRAGWAWRWRDPTDEGSWTTIDLRLERSVGDRFTATFEAANLLDREISELHGVPLPGRWLSLSLRYTQPE